MYASWSDDAPVELNVLFRLEIDHPQKLRQLGISRVVSTRCLKICPRSNSSLASRPVSRALRIGKCWYVFYGLIEIQTQCYVQEQRNRLPIAQYRSEIVSALETSQVLVLSGETGW
jgi:hypothetical protein